ncbi:antitoxin YefM [Clostridiales Family XIII bacterium PM5-7]
MINTNSTQLRKDLFNTLEQAVKYNEPINVMTKNGNAIIISEADYNSMMETIYLHSVPGLVEEIIAAGSAPDSEFVDEKDVEW